MSKTMLKDLGFYKQTIISSFLQNPDIMECLLGGEYTNEQVDDVVYKQIFPYLYVDETQSDPLVYIGVEIEPSSAKGSIKDCKLVIWAYCHKDIMKYTKRGYIGTRIDILTDMIDCTIRNLDLGIGSPEFISAPHIEIAKKYYGRSLTYVVPDFAIKGR